MFSIILVAITFLCQETSALEQCDSSISDQFLAKNQLEPTVLQYLCGHSYWRAAVSNYVSSKALVKFQYGEMVNNACNFSMISYSTGGYVLYENNFVVAEVLEEKYLGHYLAGTMAAYYLFNCSNNLVAMYRCQMAWQSEGPKYVLLAPWDMYEADIAKEREVCKKEIMAIDSSADIVDNQRPFLS